MSSPTDEDWAPSDDDAPDAPQKKPPIERGRPRAVEPDEAAVDDGRIVVELPGKLIEVVDLTIAGLAKLDIFQRGGALAQIIRAPKIGDDKIVQADGAPRIRLVPQLRLRELASIALRYVRRRREDKGNGKYTLRFQEEEPPQEIIATAMARGEWHGIRPLEGLVSWPILRSDGSIFLGPGYDISTQIYATEVTEIEPFECVTPELVSKAVADIDDLIGEFPFETPAHKAAWVAALLTVVARRTITGPLPMLIIDATAPGSGKSALADTLGAILLGSTLPRRAIPKDDEEWRKAMVGIGIGAYPLLLLDNLKGTLRSAVLDAVLTGTEFQDRALSQNQEITVSIPTLFVLTTNNATLDSDLIRRSIHCRIVVDDENPANRTGFRYELPSAAMKPEIRRRLLTAAAVILMGYDQAGRPPQECRPMGSFDSWCRAVQHPLVWAGFSDPAATQDELREQADSDGELHAQVLTSWFNHYGDKQHVLGTVISDLEEDKSQTALALASSLSSLGKNGRIPSPADLSYKLRKWLKKRANGLKLVKGKRGSNGTPWGVER